MSPNFSARFARAIDIALAIAGLIIAGPLMAAIAVVILLESPGPVLFAQTRLGRQGRRFQIYKFRKFRPEIGRDGLGVTLRNDPRMTRVGDWLARTKLDELPQLFNILRGDMSFVGPRPESLKFADCFTGPHQRVLEFTPGIFGPSQVAFRDEAAYFPPSDQEQFYREVLFPLKARTDLAYYPNRSLASDFAWIVRGVLAVVGWGHGVAQAGDLRRLSTAGEGKPQVE